MRKSSLFLSVLLTLSVAYATSYLLTLQQKVTACRAVLRLSLTEVQPPQATNRSIIQRVCICKAKVLEVLKGPLDLKEIQFRFHPYDGVKLPSVGGEYFVFLHELDDVYWVLQGPYGVRPIADQYDEARILAKGKISTETFSHTNFVAAIRAFAAEPDTKKQ